MTARIHAERSALVSALVHPEAAVDAVRDGSWRPDLFLDDHRRATALAIEKLVLHDELPTMLATHEQLVDDGMSDLPARDAVLLVGAADAIGFRLSGLTHWLHRLVELDERIRLGLRLADLVDSLDRPGGVDRVARALGVVA